MNRTTRNYLSGGSHSFMTLATPTPRESTLNRVSGHALTLNDAGDWCPPSCTAKCGRLVLSQVSDNTQIVNCFKNECGCKVPNSEMIDKDLFNRYQEEIRLENLLL